MHSETFGKFMRRPSAFLPIVMSMLSLVVVLTAVLWSLGTAGNLVRDTDEGTSAHLFQLLMTAQVPIVVFFLLRWLRREPRRTLQVLALQAGGWLAACAPVYLLKL